MSVIETKNSGKIIYALIKLVDKESYAQDLINGNVRLSTLRSFKEYQDENGEMRGDPCEGIIRWLQPEKISVKQGDLDIQTTEIESPVFEHADALLDSHCFCIYAMNSGNFEKVSEENLKEFPETLQLHRDSFGLGNYVVLIHNVREFQSRIISALEDNQSGADMSLVNYFDETEHHERLDPQFDGFHKRSQFSHQNEYRILTNELQQIEGEPKVLNIGDLSDIATITTPTELNAKLNVSLPANESL